VLTESNSSCSVRYAICISSREREAMTFVRIRTFRSGSQSSVRSASALNTELFATTTYCTSIKHHDRGAQRSRTFTSCASSPLLSFSCNSCSAHFAHEHARVWCHIHSSMYTALLLCFDPPCWMRASPRVRLEKAAFGTVCQVSIQTTSLYCASMCL
jgi:Tfp pilus assembly protein PilV